MTALPRRLATALAAAGSIALCAVGLCAPAATALDGGLPILGPDGDALAYLSDSEASCTGTLIDPHWVLTAKHCVRNHDTATLAIGGAQVELRDNGVPVTHPGADIALVYLPQASTKTPAALPHQATPLGAVTRAIGWGGAPRNPLTGTLLAPTTGRATITDRFIAPSTIPDNRNLPYLEARIDGARLVIGDSGGPLINEAGEVVAVASMADTTAGHAALSSSQPQAGTTGWFVPVADYLDWITQTTSTPPHLAEAPHQQPEPTAALSAGLSAGQLLGALGDLGVVFGSS